MPPVRRIRADRLAEAMKQALSRHNVEPLHAAYLADTLVETSLLGVDTHGIRLFDTYIKELEGGRGNPKPNISFQGDKSAARVMNADGALGPVAGNVAMRAAMEQAKISGIAAVAVGNSNHFGAAGYYAALAAGQDQIGFAFSNSDALVSPFNGREPLNGTNPIAMAAPGLEKDGLRLDMATSQVSYSKVMHHRKVGDPVEAGWARDGDGADTSERGEVHSLQPLGGYKGQGLGMMVQILSTLLSDMPFDSRLSHLYSPPYDAPRQIGHFFICIDIAAFISPAAFRQRNSEMLDIFRRSPAIGADPVIVPGDPERAAYRDRSENGIPVDHGDWMLISKNIKISGIEME